jgi:opacity protein-like surface antigen
MNIKIKSILIAVVFLVMHGVTQAQIGYSVLSYSVGIPTADLSDFTDQVSGRGIAFDYNHFINDQYAIGLGLGWQTFYEDRGYQTVTDETANISGEVFHYVNSFPMHLTGTYFLNSSEQLKPFAAMGIGTVYNKRRQEIGLLSTDEDVWHFSLRPEVGVQYDINYNTGLRFSVRYNMAFEAGDIGNYSHLALALGFVWIR